MVETEGFDLRYGGGRLAALECPRHSIHYRSGSNPHERSAKNKNPLPYGRGSLFLEKIMRFDRITLRGVHRLFRGCIFF